VKSPSFKPVFFRNSGLQQHAGGDDGGALDGGAHHGGHVDIAEIGGIGRHRLRGRRRAAAFLDFEVDIFSGIEALGLAVIKRRVLAIDIPVEHQHHLVGRLGRNQCLRRPDQRHPKRCEKPDHINPPFDRVAALDGLLFSRVLEPLMRRK
jgi:hypothetical protein